MQPGDNCLFVPSPQQGDPRAVWMPGEIIAVRPDGTATVLCRVDPQSELIDDIGHGWLRVVSREECQRVVDEHNAKVMDEFLARGES